MKKLSIIAAVFIFFTATSYVYAKTDSPKPLKVKNRYFEITMPETVRGLYEDNIQKDRICIYDKASKKAGFGGFAFGIKVYKSPADHAVLPGSRKIGELTDKRGNLYDVVLKHPTDVQYDYTKS